MTHPSLRFLRAAGAVLVLGIACAGGPSAPGAEARDVPSAAWREAPPLPTPRSGLTAAHLDGAIHVVGGEEPSGARTFADHEVLDPATGAWRAGPPLPVSRHGRASAVVGGAWHVIGGATGAGGATFTTLSGSVDVLEGRGEGPR